MVNPVGAVPIFDGGVPRTITVLNPVGVTGGQLVYFSGAVGNVSSGADTYASSDIVIAGLASGLNFNGLVITPGTTASGTNSYVSVATQGTFIVQADGTVFGGQAVFAGGADAVHGLGSATMDANGPQGLLSQKVGRALLGATSGTAVFTIIQLTP